MCRQIKPYYKNTLKKLTLLQHLLYAKSCVSFHSFLHLTLIAVECSVIVAPDMDTSQQEFFI